MFSNGLKSCVSTAPPRSPSSTPISDTEQYSQAVTPLSILAYKVEALEALIQQLIGSIQLLFGFSPSRAGRRTALDCRICISNEAAAVCPGLEFSASKGQDQQLSGHPVVARQFKR